MKRWRGIDEVKKVQTSDVIALANCIQQVSMQAVKAHCRRVDIAGEFVVSVVTVLRNVCQRAVHLAAQNDNQERSALGAIVQTAEAT